MTATSATHTVDDLRPERPNICFIMTDQQRADCLGVEGHPVVQTPTLDWLASTGYRFSSAYAACPICIPARRTLMSGQRPATHRVLHNFGQALDAPTLPGCLTQAGYQTHLAGKLHLWPVRKNYGFEHMRLADGPFGTPETSDYARMMNSHGLLHLQRNRAHGIAGNSWNARPWHLDESLHQTNWVTDEAIDFIERRDPTRPFFLNVSYFYPHPPCTPPRVYYDRYMDMDLPDPIEAEWSHYHNTPSIGMHPNPPFGSTTRMKLTPQMLRQFQAAYFGSITHIDAQIQRILVALPPNTIVAFCSDHGEMLGDHQFVGKQVPYEGSARVPLIVNIPGDKGDHDGETVINQPVELMDLMPTFLDMAGGEVPDTVEGRSVMPLLRGEADDWRSYVHGEISGVAQMDSGMQYLTDGQQKYVWWPARGEEQLFDLADDPQETRNLAGDASHADTLSRWRNRLIDELRNRPEGFVADDELVRLPGPTPRSFDQPASL